MNNIIASKCCLIACLHWY